MKHCVSKTARRLPRRGKRLKIAGVAQPDPEKSADDKQWKRRAGKPAAENVRPERKTKRGGGNTPEICLRAADLSGAAVAADRGNGKQQRG